MHSLSAQPVPVMAVLMVVLFFLSLYFQFEALMFQFMLIDSLSHHAPL